jgi:hypothetical protein
MFYFLLEILSFYFVVVQEFKLRASHLVVRCSTI